MNVFLSNCEHYSILMYHCMVLCCRDFTMADSIMSKAATMEIPINSNGDTGTPEDDSLEQVSHMPSLTCLTIMNWFVAISLVFSVLLYITAQSRNKAGQANCYLIMHRPATIYCSYCICYCSQSKPAAAGDEASRVILTRRFTHISFS